MLRGLDGFIFPRLGVESGPTTSAWPTCGFQAQAGECRSRNLSVVIARGRHLFPFRTEKLSPSAPMVLGLRGPGRVGRRRSFIERAAFGRPVFVVDGGRCR